MSDAKHPPEPPGVEPIATLKESMHGRLPAIPAPARTTKRGNKTRRLLIDAAMRQFAEHGYADTRLEDIATDAGVTRGALLKHFGSKEDLFFEVHKQAAFMLPGFMDTPQEVLERGFYETLRHWLNSEHMVNELFVPFRVYLIGCYSTDLEMQKRISRFWTGEDPEKTVDFVDFGKELGEIRDDLDPYAIAAVLDWIADGIQRAASALELDRGLFHRRGETEEEFQERRQRTIDAMISILRHGLERPPAG